MRRVSSNSPEEEKLQNGIRRRTIILLLQMTLQVNEAGNRLFGNRGSVSTRQHSHGEDVDFVLHEELSSNRLKIYRHGLRLFACGGMGHVEITM